jgi:hypothetical protein
MRALARPMPLKWFFSSTRFRVVRQVGAGSLLRMRLEARQQHRGKHQRFCRPPALRMGTRMSTVSRPRRRRRYQSKLPLHPAIVHPPHFTLHTHPHTPRRETTHSVRRRSSLAALKAAVNDKTHQAQPRVAKHSQKRLARARTRALRSIMAYRLPSLRHHRAAATLAQWRSHHLSRRSRCERGPCRSFPLQISLALVRRKVVAALQHTPSGHRRHSLTPPWSLASPSLSIYLRCRCRLGDFLRRVRSTLLLSLDTLRAAGAMRR